jgi:hypothetical protein
MKLIPCCSKSSVQVAESNILAKENSNTNSLFKDTATKHNLATLRLTKQRIARIAKLALINDNKDNIFHINEAHKEGFFRNLSGIAPDKAQKKFINIANLYADINVLYTQFNSVILPNITRDRRTLAIIEIISQINNCNKSASFSINSLAIEINPETGEVSLKNNITNQSYNIITNSKFIQESFEPIYNECNRLLENIHNYELSFIIQITRSTNISQEVTLCKNEIIPTILIYPNDEVTISKIMESKDEILQTVFILDTNSIIRFNANSSENLGSYADFNEDEKADQFETDALACNIVKASTLNYEEIYKNHILEHGDLELHPICQSKLYVLDFAIIDGVPCIADYSNNSSVKKIITINISNNNQDQFNTKIINLPESFDFNNYQYKIALCKLAISSSNILDQIISIEGNFFFFTKFCLNLDSIKEIQSKVNSELVKKTSKEDNNDRYLRIITEQLLNFPQIINFFWEKISLYSSNNGLLFGFNDQEDDDTYSLNLQKSFGIDDNDPRSYLITTYYQLLKKTYYDCIHEELITYLGESSQNMNLYPADSKNIELTKDKLWDTYIQTCTEHIYYTKQAKLNHSKIGNKLLRSDRSRSRSRSPQIYLARSSYNSSDSEHKDLVE